MCLADHDALAWFKEDEDGESVWDDLHSPPTQQEFSLLDLAKATRHKRHQKPIKNSCRAVKDTETVSVNSASNQHVRKYAKGSIIFIQKDFIQKTAAEVDTDGDSGLNSDTESNTISLELSSAAVTNHEEDLARFDDGFCSYGIPQHEFGRSSQILKLRQYSPYIYHIKENLKENALAKFHAFISNKSLVLKYRFSNINSFSFFTHIL